MNVSKEVTLGANEAGKGKEISKFCKKKTFENGDRI